jgi:hypothetical protein
MSLVVTGLDGGTPGLVAHRESSNIAIGRIVEVLILVKFENCSDNCVTLYIEKEVSRRELTVAHR